MFLRSCLFGVPQVCTFLYGFRLHVSDCAVAPETNTVLSNLPSNVSCLSWTLIQDYILFQLSNSFTSEAVAEYADPDVPLDIPVREQLIVRLYLTQSFTYCAVVIFVYISCPSSHLLSWDVDAQSRISSLHAHSSLGSSNDIQKERNKNRRRWHLNRRRRI